MGTRKNRGGRALQRAVHSPEREDAIARSDAWQLARVRRDQVIAWAILGGTAISMIVGLALVLAGIGVL